MHSDQFENEKEKQRPIPRPTWNSQSIIRRNMVGTANQRYWRQHSVLSVTFILRHTVLYITSTGVNKQLAPTSESIVMIHKRYNITQSKECA